VTENLIRVGAFDALEERVRSAPNSILGLTVSCHPLQPYEEEIRAKESSAEVKPRAYQEAATYLRKARAVMFQQGRQEQWQKYLLDLRETHARKRRLIEILDDSLSRSHGLPD
jgi:hypothetical protein